MNPLFSNFIIIATTTLFLWLLFHKRFHQSPVWHATATPLASIIGSGFLVSAPLLMTISGHWAPLAMLGIVLIAYGLGSSIRFNILHVEPLLKPSKAQHWLQYLEKTSRLALGIAYIISVTFYLKLLAAFALHGLGYDNTVVENTITTLLLLFIGIVGKLRGLSLLELLEVFSVNTKLAIIAAALLGFFFFNLNLALEGQWTLEAYPHDSPTHAFRQVLGMLLIVQGFETSRYLGYGYTAEMRVKTMRYAQIIAGIIYLTFTVLSMILFSNIHEVNETTIIKLCQAIAPILPLLLIIAAVMSQFSAAVADTIGSGGLLVETTQQKISVKTSYLVIASLAIALTWATNIFEIITIASKAFAIYYALQNCLSLIVLLRTSNTPHKIGRTLLYLGLLLLMLLVITVGIPVE